MLKQKGVLLENSLKAIDLTTDYDITRFREINIPEHLILPVIDCVFLLKKTISLSLMSVILLQKIQKKRYTLPGKTLNLNVNKAKAFFLTNYSKKTKGLAILKTTCVVKKTN